jgi:hypothetical protein
MYVEWHSAGSAQVVSPAAAWLSDFMLDQALTLLSPGSRNLWLGLLRRSWF